VLKFYCDLLIYLINKVGMNLSKLKRERGIYVIEHLSTGMKYVGYSVNVYRRALQHLNGKKQLIDRTILHFGEDDFEITASYYPELSRKNLIDIETQLIEDENALSPNGYNEMSRGSCRPNYTVTQETKNNISKALIGRVISSEHRQKISKALLGFKHTTESKENMKKSRTPEVRAAISCGGRGKKRSTEHCQKQSNRMRASSVTYHFHNSGTNESFIGICLDFAKRYSLNYRSAVVTFNQKRSYKGWTRS
jgi:group I intron endonuclease